MHGTGRPYPPCPPSATLNGMARAKSAHTETRALAEMRLRKEKQTKGPRLAPTPKDPSSKRSINVRPRKGWEGYTGPRLSPRRDGTFSMSDRWNS